MRPTVIVAVCLISGCGIGKVDHYAPRNEAAEREAREIAYTRSLAAQCDAIGYQRDTDPWRNCLLQLHQQAQAERAQGNAVLMQEILRRQGQQQYQAMPLCSTLPPGIRGYQQAQGTCR